MPTLDALTLKPSGFCNVGGYYCRSSVGVCRVIKSGSALHIPNPEFGLIIESPKFADAVAEEFEASLVPVNSWQVLLEDKNCLVWKSGDKVIRKEPARTFWQRFQSGFFGLFDLDDQL
jgi:hypothetical protein